MFDENNQAAASGCSHFFSGVEKMTEWSGHNAGMFLSRTILLYLSSSLEPKSENVLKSERRDFSVSSFSI